MTESACGIDSISLMSAREAPLCTSAVKPPTKSTPTSLPARSIASAMGVRSSSRTAEQISAIGVTEIRLLTIGMPNSRSSCSATGTSSLAALTMRLYTLRATASALTSAHPRRLRPSVMVRMSRCSSLTIESVSAISWGVICIAHPFGGFSVS